MSAPGDDEKLLAEAEAAMERERELVQELRRQRERRRETQQEVGERLGAKHQTISQRERMEYRASVQDFILWAQTLGLEFDIQLRPPGDLGDEYREAATLLPLVWAEMSPRDRRRMVADWRLIFKDGADKFR